MIMEISREEYENLIGRSIKLNMLLDAVIGSMAMAFDGERVIVKEEGQILIAANLIAPDRVIARAQEVTESDGGRQKAYYQELIRKQKEEQNGDQ